MSGFAHEYPFDPAYGHDRESLMRAALADPVPDGFADFWRGLRERAGSVSPDPVVAGEETVWPEHACRIRRVRYRSLGDRKIGGWLVTPLEGPVRRLVVAGHGYGGRAAPEPPLLPDSACLFFCARGLPTESRYDDIPESAPFHVLCGIQSPDTYVHGGCCADLWAAASVLRELTGGGDLPLHYWGGSFGGGIGALALAWDRRFTAAHLVVPSFGNHPFRLGVPCVGSGEAVRMRWRRDCSVAKTLALFDAAHAARFLRLPVLYACALFDPAVPPPGQFSIWNAHAGPKDLVVLSAGHFPHDNEASEIKAAERRAREFLLAAERNEIPPASPIG